MKKLLFFCALPLAASTCCQQTTQVSAFEFSTFTLQGDEVPHAIMYDMPNYYCFNPPPELTEPSIIIPYVPPNPPSEPPSVPEPKSIALTFGGLLLLWRFRAQRI